MNFPLFDSHCHLTWEEEKHSVADTIQRAQAQGVQRFLCVAIDLASAQRCAAIASQHQGVFASIGIHPNDVGAAAELPQLLSQLQEQATDSSFVAIGETGLDFFRDSSQPETQIQSLKMHLELAAKLDLPIILHCRSAIQTLLPILQDFGAKSKGVMHCYSEGPEHIEALLELGLHISFAGNLSYPKSEALRQASRLVPLDRILVETDAPFLAPQAMRGKRNEPSFLPHTLECLAESMGLEAQRVAAATYKNACKLFKVS